jgi:hypothetical protein
MIYCNSYNPKDEIYFCKNTGSPDNVSNWSCSILPTKDKPWIIALGGGITIRLTGVVSNVAYFYKDGSTVYLLDNGATWTSLGNAVSFNPGSSTACPNFNRPAKIHNHITAQGNNIAVSFIKLNGPYCNVGIAYSTDGGSTFNGSDIAHGCELFTFKPLCDVARESGKSMGNKMGIFNELGNQNPAGHDYNGFDYYGDDAGAVYFTRTSYTSVEEMVKLEDYLYR